MRHRTDLRKILLRTLALACLYAGAAGASAWLVVTDENLPPFSFVRNGEAAGVDVEMLRRAADGLGLELKVTALPWKRVLYLLESGAVPLAMPLFRTPEREALARFAAPVHFSMTGIFVRRGREFPFASVADLRGKRFGYNRGYALPPELQQALLRGEVEAEEVGTTVQNVEKLLSGRVDFVVANVANTQFTLKDSPLRAEIVQLPRLLSERRPAYLVLSRALAGKDAAAQLAALRQALEGLHRDGTYGRILARYVQ